MITPGTKFVTVGGCIANDVHGKAHHAQGSFSTCVEESSCCSPSGEVVRASRDENADLFWATFGGMGLLGVVLSARLRLRKIESTYFRQKAIPVENLEAMLTALEESDQPFPYSVATLDVTAKGPRLGPRRRHRWASTRDPGRAARPGSPPSRCGSRAAEGSRCRSSCRPLNRDHHPRRSTPPS